MKDTDFQNLLKSISQAGEIKRGEKNAFRSFVDVKEIRMNLGLTQSEFAHLAHIRIQTLQNWEQKRRVPQGPALSLLIIIKNNPKAAIDALNKEI